MIKITIYKQPNKPNCITPGGFDLDLTPDKTIRLMPIKKKPLSEAIKSVYTNIPVATIEGNGLQDSQYSHETVYYGNIGRTDKLKILDLELDSFAVMGIKAIHVYGGYARVRLYITSLGAYGNFQIRKEISMDGQLFEFLHLYMDKDSRGIFMTVQSPVFCDYTLEAYRNCKLLREDTDIDVTQLTEIKLN